MNDLVGIGKLGEKLIEELSAAIGVAFKPLTARAEAESLRIIGEAQTKTEDEKIRALARSEAYKRVTLAAADEEIEMRAERRKRASLIQRQRNIESIFSAALGEVEFQVSDEPTDPDWITKFIAAAQDVSNPETQKLWAKLLAQEVAQPGRFSIKSLQILQSVTRREAESFERVCQCLVGFVPDVASHLVNGSYCKHSGDVGFEDIELRNFGVAYTDILTLQSVGLMYSERLVIKIDGDGDLFYQGRRIHCVREPEISISTMMKKRFLTWKKNEEKRSEEKTDDFYFELKVYVLTPVGVEMTSLIPVVANSGYIDALCSLLSKRFKVTE